MCDKDTILKADLLCMGTLFLTVNTWLTPENVDMALKIVTGVAAAIAAFFASRYHYYAAQERKALLKKMEDEKKRNDK